MAVMFKIAWRYLKRQKRHTMMTILMVALSVGLITAITSVYGCFDHTMMEMTKAEIGPHHVSFKVVAAKDKKGVEKHENLFEKAQKLSRNAYFEQAMVGYSTGLNIVGSSSGTRFELLEIAPFDEDTSCDDMSATVMSCAPENPLNTIDERYLSKGRLPEKAGEIMIPKKTYEALGYPALGTKITVNLEKCMYTDKVDEPDVDYSKPYNLIHVVNRDIMVYTVVGVDTENYTGVIFHNTDPIWYKFKDVSTWVYARFYPNDVRLYDLMNNQILKGTGINGFSMNKNLLKYENIGADIKGEKIAEFAMVALFVFIILACCRLVIDCAFEISSQERIRQYGLLMSMGASRGQLVGILFWESIFIGGIGSLLGTGVGLGLYWALYKIVKGLDGLQWLFESGNMRDMLSFTISPAFILFGIIAGIGWVFFSSYGTGMRIIKKTPAEAISGKVTKTINKKIPKPNPILKRLGVWAHLASINSKRNRKRYVITVLSVCLSLIMFSGFSYYMRLMSITIERDLANYLPYNDFLVVFNGPDRQRELTQALRSLPYVESVQASYDGWLGESVGVDESRSWSLRGVSRETFETFDSPISYDELNRSGGVLACYNKRTADSEEYNFFTKELKYPYSFNFRGMFPINKVVNGQKPRFHTGSTTIVGVCTSTAAEYTGYHTLICTEEQAQTIFKNFIFNHYSYYDVSYTTVYIKAKEGYIDRLNGFLKSRGDVNDIIGFEQERARPRVMLEIINLIGYLVIGLIGTIAAINVVNIIITNVLNRRSEIGLLKAAGMSERQLIASNLLESAGYAVQSAFWSSLVLIAMLFLMNAMLNTEAFTELGQSFLPDYYIMFVNLFVGFLMMLAVTMLASLYPLNQIKKTSVVDAIRYQD